jgi:hypothetical protein
MPDVEHEQSLEKEKAKRRCSLSFDLVFFRPSVEPPCPFRNNLNPTFFPFLWDTSHQ